MVGHPYRISGHRQQQKQICEVCEQSLAGNRADRRGSWWVWVGAMISIGAIGSWFWRAIWWQGAYDCFECLHREEQKKGMSQVSQMTPSFDLFEDFEDELGWTLNFRQRTQSPSISSFGIGDSQCFLRDVYSPTARWVLGGVMPVMGPRTLSQVSW